MIQRIQSVYLLLVVVLMSATAFVPILSLTNASGSLLTYCSMGIYNAPKLENPTWGVIFFIILSALLPLISIFLYKNRKLQMRIGTMTSLSIIFLYVTLFVYYNTFAVQYGYTFAGVQYGIILPFIALIFNVLAILKIKKDEKLVRSLDRIR